MQCSEFLDERMLGVNASDYRTKGDQMIYVYSDTNGDELLHADCLVLRRYRCASHLFAREYPTPLLTTTGPGFAD